MSIKNCPSCGKEIADIAVMCPGCGYKYQQFPTKKCKHCQTDIPSKATVCPNCRKKQGGIAKWFVIGFFVVLVLSIGSGGDKEENSPSFVASVEPSKENVVKESQPEITEAPAKEEFYPGDILETKELRITYISSEQYTSDNQFIQPKEGYVFYKMDFEFENISNTDQYVSSFLFNCYADGYDMSQSYFLEESLDATLSPGKKTKGSVCYEIPVDAELVELEYEENLWTQGKIIFIVK